MSFTELAFTFWTYDEDDENDEDVDSKKDDEIGEEDLEFNSR
ncbi:3158_t:CDS:2 [Entrophospora sp. SA101]|nr:3158_t:CDS:2 [Entrophospora sp. SA101]